MGDLPNKGEIARALKFREKSDSCLRSLSKATSLKVCVDARATNVSGWR